MQAFNRLLTTYFPLNLRANFYCSMLSDALCPLEKSRIKVDLCLYVFILLAVGNSFKLVNF